MSTENHIVAKGKKSPLPGPRMGVRRIDERAANWEGRCSAAQERGGKSNVRRSDGKLVSRIPSHTYAAAGGR